MINSLRIEKVLTSVLFFTYFQLGYLWSATNISAKVSDFSFYIDRIIPLVPFFIIFYILGYIFIFSFLFYESSLTNFRWGVIHYICILTVSFIIFKQFPVYMDKDLALGSDLLSRITSGIQTNDSSYNNFPSLHVSLNIFNYMILSKNFKPILRIVIGFLTICIAISTVLVKQHLFVDVLGGLAIAAIFTFSYKNFRNQLNKSINKLWVFFISLSLIFIASQYKNAFMILDSLASYLSILN